MDNKITYHEQNDIDNTLKLREVLKTLPPFCRDYFRAIDATTTTKTRISYAYDIRIFFQFLLEQNPMFKDKTMSDFTVDVLDQVKAVDLEEYEEFLKVYKSADSSKTETNGDTDEVAMLLDYIEHCGDTLTGQKRMYHEKTKDRDLAIVTLLLGTGIRVSECVGLDVEDVDFKNNGIKVTRKGGNEMVVYFGPEVEKALKKYLEVRENITPLAGHEHALFYSTQRRRIGVQAIENLVKKYAREITTTKKITPHKLRSTYGTALYQETGDIYLVADVLGHKDVNTTKKHYAALDDARRRQAAKAVRLRED